MIYACKEADEFEKKQKKIAKQAKKITKEIINDAKEGNI